MARAIEWAMSRNVERGGQLLVVNAGSNKGNYQVRDLALAVAQAVPGTSIEMNSSAPHDPRSYRVDFTLFGDLAPEHQPRFSLEKSIEDLVVGLHGANFTDNGFRAKPHTIRLNMISHLVASDWLKPNLRWNWSVD
jgi:UDP-glucose 4-epimerase